MFRLKLREIVAVIVTICLLSYFGYKRYIVPLVIAYLIMVPTLYLIKKKKKLSDWQERFIAYLIMLPIFSFFIPLEDLLALTAGSLIAGIIISLAKSRKWRDKNEEREMLPEWEGEENRDKGEKGS